MTTKKQTKKKKNPISRHELETAQDGADRRQQSTGLICQAPPDSRPRVIGMDFVGFCPSTMAVELSHSLQHDQELEKMERKRMGITWPTPK
jgi:hypothetical protein